MTKYYKIQAEAYLKENPYNRKWQYVLKRLGGRSEMDIPESAISDFLADESGIRNVPKTYKPEFGTTLFGSTDNTESNE